ncbi:amidohydrolase family protein [Streptomyces sp. NPDC090306]|uniref:amidohydrolase family protein n=1 Tax=Streptomyces sp. NPDC090306 TaxID=3365961 RepID=UPI003807EFBA
MTTSPQSPARESARDDVLLVRSATVVNTRDGSVTPGTDVLVRDGRITEVRPGIEAPERLRARVVDAKGLFVVPGYNDMHAHPLDQLPARSRDRDLRLLLAHGVTGFRQMSGSAGLLRARAEGTLDLPSDGARPLSMPGTVLVTPLNAGSPEQGVATVRQQHAAGADFIKVAMTTPEVFFAAQQEALRLGLTIVGHLPQGIDVVRASGIGMKSVEHLGPGVGLFACCSSAPAAVQPDADGGGEDKLKAPPVKLPFMDRLIDRMVKRLVVNPVNRTTPQAVDRMRRAVDTYDSSMAHTLARRFVDDNTWQVPTLIRVKTQQIADDPAFAEAPELRHMDAPTLKRWRKATARFARFPESARVTFRELYDRQLQLTHAFDDAGVPMLAGSDTSGAGWVVPGASLHREFDELGRAGLSPLRVLQMATLRPAEFLGTIDTMGTVEPGRLADLVLLRANPVDDVENLHAVAAVIRDGRYYSETDLTAIKNRATNDR